MKLAEALQERKNLDTEIGELWGRLGENLYRPEDDAAPDEQPQAILAQIHSRLDRFEYLVTSINRTNVEAHIDEANEETIMEAIARRETLTRHVNGLKGALGLRGGEIHLRVNAIRGRSRTTKDDLKYVATMPIANIKLVYDKLAAELRKLDNDLQRANWAVDLKEV